MDALMNPGAQRGRSLIVVESGNGLAIGEATFGITEFRSQIRVYERIQLGGGYQRYRPTNVGEGRGLRGMVPAARSLGPEEGSLESIARAGAKGIADEPVYRGGRAAIGAGEEEYRQHSYTGVRYQRNAQPVIFLRTEFRCDLQPMITSAWDSDWDWFWPIPPGPNWWDESWTWRPGRTASQVPVAPHRPRK